MVNWKRSILILVVGLAAALYARSHMSSVLDGMLPSSTVGSDSGQDSMGGEQDSEAPTASQSGVRKDAGG